MKYFFTLTLFFAVCGLPARAVSINGQDYVPLAHWARANGLYGYTLKHGDEIVLTNRMTRLVFDVDSAQSQINGVNVRLSFPVAKDRDVPLIAQFDLDRTVYPLVNPSRCVKRGKITTICLDPGHGGMDSGNRAGWHFEKNYTLPLALELRDQLQKIGFKVILTRTKDVYVELPARPALANRDGADLFISLHFNAAQTDKDEVAGPETYCITPVGANSSNAGIEGSQFGGTIGTGPTVANRDENESLEFAYQIQKSLVQNLNVNDRGVKRARFAVLRDATMPAILVEGGFMTNPAESKRIYSAAWRRQLAAAIVKGILAYQKMTEPDSPEKVSDAKSAK